MKIKDLESLFISAKKRNKDIALELTVPGQRDTEVIIVKHSNLDYKLDYYISNYTDNLELERCKNIKILKAKTCDFIW